MVNMSCVMCGKSGSYIYEGTSLCTLHLKEYIQIKVDNLPISKHYIILDNIKKWKN